MGYGLGMPGLAGLYQNPFLTRDQPTTEIWKKIDNLWFVLHSNIFFHFCTSSNPGILMCIKCSESFDSLQDLFAGSGITGWKIYLFLLVVSNFKMSFHQSTLTSCVLLKETLELRVVGTWKVTTAILPRKKLKLIFFSFYF